MWPLKKIKPNKTHFLLILICLLGLVLRLWQVDKTPPSLNWDEVSHGYNAYSILLTGKDQWGQFLPLANFRAFGDYPLPANLYLTIPSIILFGLNEFSIRLPHVILGTLLVPLGYFLMKGLGFKGKIGLLTAALIALDPWTFFPSRFVVQSNIGLFFVVLGITLWLFRKRALLFLPLSIVSLGLSLYSYHNTRIFTPLLLLTLIVLYKDEWREWWSEHRKYLILSISILLLFFLPLLFIFTSEEAKARANWVSIVDQGAINRINEARSNSDLSPVLSKLFYNKVTYIIPVFSSNYLSYFSPQFLFFNGGTDYQLSIPGNGVLYTAELPFFYLGLISLLYFVVRNKRKDMRLLFFWLLLAPIPAAMTLGQNHVIRATTMLPIPQILTSIGFILTLKLIAQRSKRIAILFAGLFLGVFLTSGIKYLDQYFNSYRNEYSWSWQYGYKEVAQYLKGQYGNYDKIYVTKKYGEPHEFILFFWPWNPQSYLTDENKILDFHSNWYWVDRLDKFYFINDWEVTSKAACLNGKEKCLLVAGPDNIPKEWQEIERINFLNEKPAFVILEK